MKIIGKTEGKNLLLSATEDEVARLIGYHSAWYADRGQDGRARISIEPGLDIRINEMYSRLDAQAAIPAKVRAAQKVLIEASEMLGLIAPVLKEVATGVQETTCDSTKSS